MFYLFSNFLQSIKITQNITKRQYCECEKPAYLIPLSAVTRFVVDCFNVVGAKKRNAEILAEAIVEADYRGISSEGVFKLEQYIDDVRHRICDPKAEPTVEEEFTSVAVVSGNTGFGPVTGRFCMDIAMEKALGTGIGMVVAKESNHYGMASLYTVQAAKKGFIGLSFSNGVPLMVPPRGLEVALGANPLSIAAPAHCDALVVDMSTTAVTLSKIKKYEKKKAALPQGWALNKKGQNELDPERALIFKKLLPLGNEQSHKGFGLALLVEVLSGLLSDSNCGPKIPIPKERCKKEPLNLGHGFIAINPEKFVPNFATRLTKFLNQIRDMDAVDPSKPILVPGDRERVNMKKVDCGEGIRYSKEQLDIMENLSKKLGVRPPDISTVLFGIQQGKKKI